MGAVLTQTVSTGHPSGIALLPQEYSNAQPSTVSTEIVVTGKLNITGIPDAQGNLPKIIGGGSNRLFKVESGGENGVEIFELDGGSGGSGDAGREGRFLYVLKGHRLLLSKLFGETVQRWVGHYLLGVVRLLWCLIRLL